MRLFIGTPTHSSWTPEYGHSLAWLMADLAGAKDGPRLVHHAWMDGTILPGLRMDLAKAAIGMDASHILWTDCDMRFTPAHVRSLMSRDLDIVGANYIRRLPPHQSTAIGMDGKYLIPSSGVEEVIYTGMGLMLTKVSVFEKLPQPWFLTPWSDEVGDYVGEDVWFCRFARDHGFKVHVDHDASIGVGHVGKTVHVIERQPERKFKLVQ